MRYVFHQKDVIWVWVQKQNFFKIKGEKTWQYASKIKVSSVSPESWPPPHPHPHPPRGDQYNYFCIVNLLIPWITQGQAGVTWYLARGWKKGRGTVFRPENTNWTKYFYRFLYIWYCELSLHTFYMCNCDRS